MNEMGIVSSVVNAGGDFFSGEATSAANGLAFWSNGNGSEFVGQFWGFPSSASTDQPAGSLVVWGPNHIAASLAQGSWDSVEVESNGTIDVSLAKEPDASDNTDVIYHLGNGAVLYDGATEVASVSNYTLNIGSNIEIPAPELILSASQQLLGDDFNDPEAVAGAVTEQSLVVVTNDNQSVSASLDVNSNPPENVTVPDYDIIIAAGAHDTIEASRSGQVLVGLGNDLLVGGSGDTFILSGSGNQVTKLTDATLKAPTTIYFDPAGASHDVIENAALEYDLFGDPLPYAPDSTAALQNYVINFGSLSPSDLNFVGVIDTFWYGWPDAGYSNTPPSGFHPSDFWDVSDFRLGYVQVKSTGATLVLPDGRIGDTEDPNDYGLPSLSSEFYLPSSFKFVFDNGSIVYQGNQIIDELYDDFNNPQSYEIYDSNGGGVIARLPTDDYPTNGDPGQYYDTLTSEIPWAPFLSGEAGSADGLALPLWRTWSH